MSATLLEARGVHKRFGAVAALDGVDLGCAPGEIHALLGENGAGKSTLMHVVSGLTAPDAGEIRLQGRQVRWRSPDQARAAGIAMVHQHFMLVPTMTIAENLALARGALGFLDRESLAREVEQLAAERRLNVGDARRRIEDLSVGEQQRVEILKALVDVPALLILDEPTAVLTPAEVRDLFALLRELAAAGTGIVIVTHKLAEVISLADRVTVLRRGRVTGHGGARDFDENALARLMVGEESLSSNRSDPLSSRGAPVLRVDGLRLRRGASEDGSGISLTVCAGEILVIAGVEGNGQAELLAALSGYDARDSRVWLGELPLESPADARNAGMAIVPADRRRDGLVGELSLWENLLLSRDLLARAAPNGVLSPEAERQRARDPLRVFQVRPDDPEASAATLSGGNQQRLVLARELSRPGLRAVVAANPTRGLDIGATRAIHARLREIAAAGAAVLVVSTDLDEVEALASRVVVLYQGRLRVPSKERPERAVIGRLMAGVEEGS